MFTGFPSREEIFTRPDDQTVFPFISINTAVPALLSDEESFILKLLLAGLGTAINFNLPLSVILRRSPCPVLLALNAAEVVNATMFVNAPMAIIPFAESTAAIFQSYLVEGIRPLNVTLVEEAGTRYRYQLFVPCMRR